jgi:hypothetical protein
MTGSESGNESMFHEVHGFRPPDDNEVTIITHSMRYMFGDSDNTEASPNGTITLCGVAGLYEETNEFLRGYAREFANKHSVPLSAAYEFAARMLTYGIELKTVTGLVVNAIEDNNVA